MPEQRHGDQAGDRRPRPSRLLRVVQLAGERRIFVIEFGVLREAEARAGELEPAADVVVHCTPSRP